MPRHNSRAKNENYRKAGELIVAARVELEYTQEMLASALSAHLGLTGEKKITRQRVQNWEKGVAMPRPREMAVLATILHLTADEITRGEREAQSVEDAPPELSQNAQTIGKVWALLPEAGQKHIAEQMWSMLAFMEKNGSMAARVFGKPSERTQQRLHDHEKLLERLQQISRLEPAKAHPDD